MRDSNHLQTNDFYEFGDFRLDLREKKLLKNGNSVSLPPKVFDTLSILVANAGHLLEKEELMNLIWADTFVEESNLTYNVKMLRRALGDDAQRPRFIETVQRRGYRFVGDVRVGSNENAANKGSGRRGLEAREASFRPAIPRVVVAAIVILATGIGFSAYWVAKNATVTVAAPILSASSSIEKLSTNGKVLHAVVSADGKNFFYTNGYEGPQSIWLRQLESGHSVEIIPPSNDSYYGLALSPDGNFIYFARSPRQQRDMGIYRVSIFGGVPTKIISGSEGWMSISPDGKKISFVRCPYTREEYCSLWAADAISGGNERKLTSRPQPIRIADNEFSRDGRTVAFAVGQSQNQGNDFGLAEIDVESGAERELTPERFFNIKSLTWLPDGNSLLITAARIPTKHFRIWEVSVSSGSARALTNDSESYNRLSLNNEANLLVSTRSRQDFRLYVSSAENFPARRPLADASKVTFTPTGTIVFASVISGNDEIWSSNANGSEQRQLTNDPADDTGPVVSGDNKWIFFSSNRTGNSQVWRMNTDGSDQTQITFKEGGRPISVSPDGKWIYFHHGINRNLWRASISGGAEEIVLDRRVTSHDVSPNGRQVAFSELSGGNRTIGIASLADGNIVKTFLIPDQETSPTEIVWMPDGESILYVFLSGDNNALMLQPTDGSAPTKLADLGPEQINGFAVAPDGKSFAIVQGGWRHDAVLIKGLKQ